MSKNNSEVNIKIPSEKHKSRKSSLELQVNKSRKLSSRQESVEENSDDISQESKNPATTKELVGFWLLGFCCHFGYNVLMSAAYDLIDSGMRLQSQADTIHPDKDEQPDDGFKRKCSTHSTGVLLLVNVGPEIVAQIIATFSPFFLNFRMVFIVFCSFFGIITCASSRSTLFFYLGVGITSFSGGIAECTLLSYLSLFDNNKLVLTVSSAFGFSGLFASLCYVGLVALGLTTSTILYTLTFIPVLTAIAFWGIMHRPIFCSHKSSINPINRPSFGARKDNFCLNIAYIPHLYPFMIALSFVYFFEYYINQTLHQLIYFRNFTLTPRQQYRWYQVTYNVGAFLVKNSLSFITVQSLWCFPLLQGINATFLTFAAIYLLIPHFTFVLCFIFWEGLMGGYTYLTIFYTLYDQVEPERRRFSMGFVTIAENLGICAAALISQPAHTFICGLPETLSVWTKN